MYNEEEFEYKIYNIRINDASDKAGERRDTNLFNR